ncbi:hypothetical protein KUCAC02_016283, partial [Chaenocephalus aceratus]
GKETIILNTQQAETTESPGKEGDEVSEEIAVDQQSSTEISIQESEPPAVSGNGEEPLVEAPSASSEETCQPAEEEPASPQTQTPDKNINSTMSPAEEEQEDVQSNQETELTEETDVWKSGNVKSSTSCSRGAEHQEKSSET